MQESQEKGVQSLDQKVSMEEQMATHSSILACATPWTVAHQALLSLEFPRQEC